MDLGSQTSVPRAGIQPVLVQVEVTPDAIPRRLQGLRQWLGRAKFTVLGDRKHVHIPSCPLDQAEGSECGTADHDYFHLLAKRSQLLRQRIEDHVERLAGDLHTVNHTRNQDVEGLESWCSKSRFKMLRVEMVVLWLRLQMILLPAQGVDGAATAKVALVLSQQGYGRGGALPGLPGGEPADR